MSYVVWVGRGWTLGLILINLGSGALPFGERYFSRFTFSNLRFRHEGSRLTFIMSVKDGFSNTIPRSHIIVIQ